MKIKNKKLNKGLAMQAGVATLELLIAFAILVLNITAVVLIINGGQSVSVDSETNEEAIAKAKSFLAEKKALAKNNFLSIIDEPPTTEMSGALTYTKELAVEDETECRKKITSSYTWLASPIRPQKIEFTTLITDIAGALALGGDCATSPPSTDWTNPQTFTSADIVPGGNQGTDIDVIKIAGQKYAFLTSVHSSAASNDFWSFDLEVTPPLPVGQLNTGAGLNVLDVAKDLSSGEIYAYAGQDSNVNQFRVIRITTPSSPSLVASRTLPNITFTCSPASSPCLAPQSIFFYNGRVYIGTRYIANLALPPTQNNEFHVYCVSDTSIPLCSPSNPVWLGSFNVNHNVNSIAVSGTTAYLATSGVNQELTVLDISSPGSITPFTPFDAFGAEDGTSVALMGNKIYLGRAQTAASRPELYILDRDDLSIIAEKDLNLNPSAALVEDIATVSNFIFLGTSDSGSEFQVWNSNNLTSIWSFFNFPQSIAGIEFMDDKIYAAVKSNSALHVIYDAP